jgi:hypothetical protein
MRFHRLVIIFAISVLFGFAPAPFPKPDRDRRADVDPIPLMQGTWRVEQVQWMGPDGLRTSAPMDFVRIDKDRWLFYLGQKGLLRAYRITREAKGWPRQFRLTRSSTGTDLMIGVVAVEGKTVKLLYRHPSDDAEQIEPRNFRTVPSGWHLMVLKRE